MSSPAKDVLLISRQEDGLAEWGGLQGDAGFLLCKSLHSLSGEALGLFLIKEPVRGKAPAEQEEFSVDPDNLSCSKAAGSEDFDLVFLADWDFHEYEDLRKNSGTMVRRSIQNRKCPLLVVYWEA